MPIYAYSAVRTVGRGRVNGRIVAENERHARQLLRESGVTPTVIEERAAERPKAPALAWLATFSRQLGTLLKNGFPMDKALEVLAAGSADESMKAILVTVDENVKQGAKLSEALGKAMGQQGRGRSRKDYGAVGELIAMIEAGEASGDLSEVLVRYAELLDRQIAFRRRLRGALFYPLIVAFIAAAVVVFLFIHVLPTITKLFDGTKVALPLPTRILFGIADLVQTFLWPGVGALAVGAIVARRYWGSESVRLRLEEILHAMPMIGPVLQKAAVARWARTFGSLLSNGVDILSSLDLAGRSARSPRIRKAVVTAGPRVAEGVPLARALRDTGAFPQLAIEAVVVGENSNALPDMLVGMAEGWESEVEASAERLADMLEPLILVIMGIVVGGIVIAVLLPIFELNASIR